MDALISGSKGKKKREQAAAGWDRIQWTPSLLHPLHFPHIPYPNSSPLHLFTPSLSHSALSTSLTLERLAPKKSPIPIHFGPEKLAGALAARCDCCWDAKAILQSSPPPHSPEFCRSPVPTFPKISSMYKYKFSKRVPKLCHIDRKVF